MGRSEYYKKNSKGIICSECKLGYHGSCQAWLCVCSECVSTVDKQKDKTYKLDKFHNLWYKRTKDNPGGLVNGVRGEAGKYRDETSINSGRAVYSQEADEAINLGRRFSSHVGQGDWEMYKAELRIDRDALRRGALDVEMIDWMWYDRTGKIRPLIMGKNIVDNITGKIVKREPLPKIEYPEGL